MRAHFTNNGKEVYQMALCSKASIDPLPALRKIHFGVLGELIRVYEKDSKRLFRCARMDESERNDAAARFSKNDVVLLGCILSESATETFIAEFDDTTASFPETEKVAAYALGVSGAWLRGVVDLTATEINGMQRIFHDMTESFFCALLRALAVYAPHLSRYELRGALNGTGEIVESLLAASLIAISGAEKEKLVISAVRQYMEKHCQQSDLTIADIAKKIGFSRAQLHRLFSKHRLSSSELLLQVRMQKAQRLLYADKSARMDIEMIAQLCGYAGSCTFGKAFKRTYGLPPSEWRNKKNRNAKGELVMRSQTGAEKVTGYGG